MPRKRRSRKQDPALDHFAREFTAVHKTTELQINPGGEISMSDAISLLIEPFKEDAQDLQAYRTLISIACLAWNMTILPTQARQDTMNKLIAQAPDLESRMEMIGLVTELMGRKRMLFPDVDRTIIEFKVTDQGKDFHLAVASTLNRKEDSK